MKCRARLMIGNCAAYVYCTNESGNRHQHTGQLTGLTQRYTDNQLRTTSATETDVPKATVSWGYGYPVHQEDKS